MIAKPAEYSLDSKQTSKLLFFGLFFLVLFAFMTPTKASTQRDLDSKECIPIKLSFIQPWGSDYFPNHQLWYSELLSLQRLGVDEVVFQWAVWGPELSQDIQLPVWMEAAVAQAKQSGTKIWFGLRYDPSFIEKLKKEGQPYLNRRLKETRLLANALKAQIHHSTHPDEVFSGWYIPDEIDGRLLLDSKLRPLLTQYATQTRDVLREVLPGPVAISGYADLKVEPIKLASHWNNFMSRSSIDILFLQDGLGAKLMEPNSSRSLQRAISLAFRAQTHRVIPVIEIFEIDPRTVEFRTIPTTMNTLESRLENARSSPDQPVALFSLSSHVLRFDNKHSRDIEEFLAHNAQLCDNTDRSDPKNE